jgi:glycosyltransferase involved in cell wall biosynthesis
VGATPSGVTDELGIGYARILRLPLKIVISKEHTPLVLRIFGQSETMRWFISGVLRRLRRYRRKLFEKLGVKSEVVVPNLNRAVKAITPVALGFSPDVVHAHDYTALPVAGAIVEILRRANKNVQLVYDAHEYVPGVAHLTKPMATLYTKIERKYSKRSAAILSVSEPMNDLLLEQLQISHRPTIVANDPLVEGQERAARNLRADIGITAEIPLLVYSGAVAPQRGIQTALAALPELPGVHLALIANPKNKSVMDLVAYLSTADIGLIPILHRLNHEISLITKFGEYMQALLPILVSDVKTMSAEVIRLGNGEVFIAEDVADFTRAAKLVLGDLEKYRAAYTNEVLAERSWERQAQVLLATYNRIAGAQPQAREHKPFLVTEPKPLETEE